VVKTTARPRLVAVRWTRKPAATPDSETIAARRPWVMLREIRYIMFGPGVSTIASATDVTPRAALAPIMPFLHHCRISWCEGISQY
jgi:hypothetical protein